MQGESMKNTPVATKYNFPTYKLKPIVRKLSADFETPASVYLKLADSKPSFLLESVSGGEHLARYSFIGVGIEESFILNDHNISHKQNSETTNYKIEVGQDPFDVLRSFMENREFESPEGLPRFSGGLVGYLGYDAIRYIEPKVNLQPNPNYPEALYLVADTLVAFDHAFGEILLITNVKINGNDSKAIIEAEEKLDELEARLLQPLDVSKHKNNSSPSKQEFKSNVDKTFFEDSVAKAKEHIIAGDIFQVVLSQKLSRETEASPFNIYRSLRRLNPSPYMFFFNFADLAGDEPFHIIGASPELHVRLEDGMASLRPIAGTRKRGAGEAEDLILEADLLADEKEVAEHLMLVDLGRNDLGRVSKYGSVNVNEFMSVERYSHVMHIVSQVEGEINSDLDGFNLLSATFPAGTVSGAPKIRAMQIIDKLETSPRGPYAGAIGYFSNDGSMDSCIAIRTLLMEGKTISVQAGAGIVADSIPEKEYQETINKAQALAEAVIIAEGEY
jgi:anthranilate synthase component I